LVDIEKITTKKQVEQIINLAVKEAILSRIEKLGGFIDNKIPPRALFRLEDAIHLPNKNGDPVPVRSVRIRKNPSNVRKIPSKLNQYVETGNNHHIIVYKDAEGEQNGKCITFWDVVTRARKNEDLFQLPKDARGGELLYTLQKGDFFLVTEQPSEDIDWNDKKTLMSNLYKVQKISSSVAGKGTCVFIHHTVAKLEGKDGKKLTSDTYKASAKDLCELVIRKTASKLQGIKVKINLLGSLTPFV